MIGYICGFVGFIGFESLRIYKVLWSGLPIAPANRRTLYVVTIICVATFSSILAGILSDGNAIQAIIIGFSVPTGMKALCERTRRAGQSLDDDIEIRKADPALRVLHWADSYFRFRI